MTDEARTAERIALQIILDALQQLEDESRRRILKTVHTFLALDSTSDRMEVPAEPQRPITNGRSDRDLKFADRTSLSAKEFLANKQPRTDVERVTCLAYYFAHFRDMTSFI